MHQQLAFNYFHNFIILIDQNTQEYPHEWRFKTILLQKIMWLKTTALLLILITVYPLVFPPPLVELYQPHFLALPNGVCNIFQADLQHQQIDSQYYLNKILKRLNNNLLCQRPLLFNQIEHTLLTLAFDYTIKPEGYQIIVDASGINLKFADYPGYVYALQSLSQIIKDNKIQYTIIKDEPLLEYRGIMIDAARHFIGVQTIKRLIESMPLSKLNILHWHLVDDESFPVVLNSHPQLSAAGRFTSKKAYSIEDIKVVIKLAKINAVNIIPQIDTPAHVRSWGLASQWKQKDITIKCGGGTGYNGQFDVSKPQVFGLAQDVIKEIDGLFRDSPYIHLGGDQVSSNCWNLRSTDIQKFMKLKGIKNYGQLQMYWRFELKQVLPVNRRTIFWRNDAANVTTSDNDILHYWGTQADVAKITAGTKSKIILSPSDSLYLSKGQGNLWLNATQGNYAVWKAIYDDFIVFPTGVDKTRILGAEVCLWGEVSNQDTLQNNLWMRSSAFAARVWSEKKLSLHDLVVKLVENQRALEKMNVAASPITSEFCEYKPQICFPRANHQALKSQLVQTDI